AHHQLLAHVSGVSNPLPYSSWGLQNAAIAPSSWQSNYASARGRCHPMRPHTTSYCPSQIFRSMRGSLGVKLFGGGTLLMRSALDPPGDTSTTKHMVRFKTHPTKGLRLMSPCGTHGCASKNTDVWNPDPRCLDSRSLMCGLRITMPSPEFRPTVLPFSHSRFTKTRLPTNKRRKPPLKTPPGLCFYAAAAAAAAAAVVIVVIHVSRCIVEEMVLIYSVVMRKPRRTTLGATNDRSTLHPTGKENTRKRNKIDKTYHNIQRLDTRRYIQVDFFPHENTRPQPGRPTHAPLPRVVRERDRAIISFSIDKFRPSLYSLTTSIKTNAGESKTVSTSDREDGHDSPSAASGISRSTRSSRILHRSLRSLNPSFKSSSAGRPARQKRGANR
ncbi:unnamed protein product, partial [Ectocarpus fasciculatus]